MPPPPIPVDMASDMVNPLVKGNCPTCKKKEVPAIQFDVCKCWYHIKCALPYLKEDQVRQLNWFCNHCKKIGVMDRRVHQEMLNKGKEIIQVLNKKHVEEIASLKKVIRKLRNKATNTKNANKGICVCVFYFSK